MTDVPVPEHLKPYVEYIRFGEGTSAHDGVEVLLTPAGVRFAREGANYGSIELAMWLMAQAAWRGNRSEKNVADEISTHALFVIWPILGRRANPVNIEYFQNWPISLALRLRDKLLSTLHLGKT